MVYANDLLIFFENKKVLKIIINARITGVLFVDFDLNVNTYDKDGNSKKIDFSSLEFSKLHLMIEAKILMLSGMLVNVCKRIIYYYK